LRAFTFATYKTFRGSRGGIVLCKKEYADKLDAAGKVGPFRLAVVGGRQTVCSVQFAWAVGALVGRGGLVDGQCA